MQRITVASTTGSYMTEPNLQTKGEVIALLECSVILQSHSNSVNCLVEIDGILYSGSSDKTIRGWDAVTGKCVCTLSGHTNWIRCIEPLNGVLFSGSTDKTICAWNTKTFKCSATWSEQASLVRCLKGFNGILFSGSIDHTIRGWDPATGKCVSTLNGHTNWVRAMEVVAGVLYSGGDDKSIRGWDTKNAKCVSIWNGHSSLVLCLHGFGTMLFSGSRDRTIRGWDTLKSTSSIILEGHENDVSCLCTFNGLLYSGSDDKTIRSWDLNKQCCLMILNGHTNAVSSLQVCQNTMFSASADKTIRGVLLIISVKQEVLAPIIEKYGGSISHEGATEKETVQQQKKDIKHKEEKIKKLKEERKELKKELRRLKRGTEKLSQTLMEAEIKNNSLENQLQQLTQDTQVSRASWQSLQNSRDFSALTHTLLQVIELESISLQRCDFNKSDLLCQLLTLSTQDKAECKKELLAYADTSSLCEQCDDLITRLHQVQEHIQMEVHNTGLLQEREQLRLACHEQVAHLLTKLNGLQSLQEKRVAQIHDIHNSIQTQLGTTTLPEEIQDASGLTKLVQAACESYMQWKHMVDQTELERQHHTELVSSLISTLQQRLQSLQQVHSSLGMYHQLFEAGANLIASSQEQKRTQQGLIYLTELLSYYTALFRNCDNAIQSRSAVESFIQEQQALDQRIATLSKSIASKKKKLSYLHSLEENDEERAEIADTELQLRQLQYDVELTKVRVATMINSARSFVQEYPELLYIVAPKEDKGSTVERSLQEFSNLMTIPGMNSTTLIGYLDGKKWILQEYLIGKSNQSKSSFAKEAAMLIQLHHPLIVSIESVFYDGVHGYLQIPYNITMDEWLFGPALLDSSAVALLQSESEIISMLYHLLLGVHFLHQHGIVHGDIRMQSVYIQTHPQLLPILSGFNISKDKYIASPNGRSSSSIQGIAAMLEYMAPELADSSQEASTACDVYSLGVLIFKIFFPSVSLNSGVPAHHNANLIHLLERLLKVSPSDRLSIEDALAHPLFYHVPFLPRLQKQPTHLDDMLLHFAEKRKQQWDEKPMEVTLSNGSILNTFVDVLTDPNKMNALVHGARMDFIPPNNGGHAMSTFKICQDYFREIFLVEQGLFESAVDGNNLFLPNISTHSEELLQFYELFGILLGRVVMDGYAISIPLAPSVIKYIIGIPTSIQDLEAYNYKEYRKLQQSLALPFASLEQELLEVHDDHNASPPSNKVQTFLVTSRKEQLEAIKQGFNQIVEPAAAAHITAGTLQSLFVLHDFISFEMVKASIGFNDLPADSSIPSTFFDWLASLSPFNMKRFLLLATAKVSMPLQNPNKESPFALDKITVTTTSAQLKFNAAFYQLELPSEVQPDHIQLQLTLALEAV